LEEDNVSIFRIVWRQQVHQKIEVLIYQSKWCHIHNIGNTGMKVIGHNYD